MNNNSQLEALVDSCGYGLLERAKLFIAEGADVNGSHNELTPLTASIYGQNIELVEFLIASGAEINQGEHTALHEAFDCILLNMLDVGTMEPDMDELNIIELLINHGGDLTKTNKLGKTPLDFLREHAKNEADFEKMKAIFRPMIPNIDERTIKLL